MNVVNKSFFNNLAKSALLCSLGLMPLTQLNASHSDSDGFFNNSYIQANNLINNTDNRLDNIVSKRKAIKEEITKALPVEKLEIPQASFQALPDLFNFWSTPLCSTLINYLITGCVIGTVIVFGKNIMNREIQTEKNDDLVRDYNRQREQSFTHRNAEQKGDKNLHTSSINTLSNKLSELAEKLNKKETSLRISIKNSEIAKKLTSIIEERNIERLKKLRKQLREEKSSKKMLEHITDKLRSDKQELTKLISIENDEETEAMLAYNFNKVSEDLRKTEKEVTHKEKSIQSLEKSISRTLSALNKDF